MIIRPFDCYKGCSSWRYSWSWDILCLNEYFYFINKIVVSQNFLSSADTHNFDWETLTSDSRYDAVAIALAFYNGVFSFSGWLD